MSGTGRLALSLVVAAGLQLGAGGIANVRGIVVLMVLGTRTLRVCLGAAVGEGAPLEVAYCLTIGGKKCGMGTFAGVAGLAIERW